MRLETDSIGSMEIADNCLYGIHTARAQQNFAVSGCVVRGSLVKALAEVKIACAEANMLSGLLDSERGEAICSAAAELAEGLWREQIVVDAWQGGAGTSLNMNVNEVIANRALQLLGKVPGEYDYLSPLEHVNLSQSTNDTVPTALRIAAIRAVLELSDACVELQGAFQDNERQFAGVLKLGRTEMQDAVPMTAGHEFGAWAEAVARDRWRLYKAEERLREVNLGGTAIGTGINASRKYIFSVVEQLRRITGIGLARKENLIDATQNADVFAEVSGIIKTCAANMAKISADIRLLSSGPRAGIAELKLPDLQAGSSIMPGKVNPVLTELLTQAAWQVFGNDAVITYAVQGGQLELNAFMPLIAENLLGGLELLTNAVRRFAGQCVRGIEVNVRRCRENLENSAGIITALVPVIGYDAAAAIVKKMLEQEINAREAVVAAGVMTGEEYDAAVSLERITRPV